MDSDTIKCPKCGSKSTVANTIFKKRFTLRYRRCKECSYHFKSKEIYYTDWNYKATIDEISRLIEKVEADEDEMS